MEISKVKKVALYLLIGIAAVVFAFIAGSYSMPRYASPGGSMGLQNNDSVFERTGTTPLGMFQDLAPAPAPMMSAGSRAGSGGYVAKGGTTQTTAPGERKVVKTGALSVLVTKTEEAADKIKSITGALGGFVDGANIYNVSEASKEGTITIRVPADKFDEAMKKLKDIAIKVDKEQVSASDVTEQFVDQQAQLKNLQAEEEQYVKILGEARSIDDILNVSQHLSNTRGGIERLQAQIKYLSGQIDMSSITISLTEEADVQLFGIRWRPLFTIKQAFRDMLIGLSGYIDAMIAFVFALPALVLWLTTFVAGLWVAWKLFRFVKRKFFTPAI